MTEDHRKDHRVIITEGTVKKNLNPPPTSARPPPPKAQVAPPAKPAPAPTKKIGD